MTHRFALALILAGLLAWPLTGCSSSGPDQSAPEQAATEEEGGAGTEPSAAAAKAKTEEALLELFEAPPLAERFKSSTSQA